MGEKTIQIYSGINKQYDDDMEYRERRLAINQDGFVLDDQKASVHIHD